MCNSLGTHCPLSDHSSSTFNILAQGYGHALALVVTLCISPCKRPVGLPSLKVENCISTSDQARCSYETNAPFLGAILNSLCADQHLTIYDELPGVNNLLRNVFHHTMTCPSITHTHTYATALLSYQLKGGNLAIPTEGAWPPRLIRYNGMRNVLPHSPKSLRV